MGIFRFYNLNRIHRTYISNFHSCSHKNIYLHPRNPVIQALGSSQFFENHPLVLTDCPNYKISKRWHVDHSHHRGNRSSKEGENVFRLGLAADIGLAAGKAMTAYLSGSTAIFADAAHSVSDVVLSGIALLSFKAARVPKDKEHPYGHF